MAIEIRRAADAADRAAMARIEQVVYRRDEAFDPETRLRAAEYGVLAHLDGRPAGGFTVLAMDSTLRGGRVGCGGIGSVGTLPECRATGVGSAMMRWALGDMRDAGFALAALYPYRESYYRRFGYEWAGTRWAIRCPQHRWPSLPPLLPARKIEADEVLALRPAYEAYAARRNGANHRSDADWVHRLGQRAPMIWAVGDPVEAYAWTAFDGGFWEELRLGELAWSTRRGYESLLAFLGGLIANRSALVWHEPSDSPFLASFLDQGVEARLDRPAMFRLLDVPQALRAIVPPADASGAFTVAVDDPDLPANRGPWRVEYDPQGVRVESAGSAIPDLHADIRAWTQAVLGEPSLEALAASGRIEAVAGPGWAAARRLLPPEPALLTEFF